MTIQEMMTTLAKYPPNAQVGVYVDHVSLDLRTGHTTLATSNEGVRKVVFFTDTSYRIALISQSESEHLDEWRGHQQD